MHSKGLYVFIDLLHNALWILFSLVLCLPCWSAGRLIFNLLKCVRRLTRPFFIPCKQQTLKLQQLPGVYKNN